MDFSKFKTSDWLMIGGGAAMLILGFALDWTTVSGFGGGDGPFDYFFTGGIAWILVVAVGVIALLRVLGNLPENQPWPLILLGASGLATLLMLLRIVLGARFDGADRGIGMFGALIWAAVALAGAFMHFQASGGELSDLKDMNKMKSSFNRGSGSTTTATTTATPPPPPPQDTSTPPPPPASSQDDSMPPPPPAK